MESLNETKKERESNFELLRIVGMIFVILHHYSLYGGLLNSLNTGINRYIGEIAFLTGKIGVNLFILISGYFLINSKFKTQKFLKLIFEVFCYSVFVIAIKGLVYKKEVSAEVLKSFFPLSMNLYWFFTVYIGIYVLSPFVNKLIHSLKKKNFEVLLIILIFMLSIIPTVILKSYFIGNLQWFILMYMIGAYIRLYGNAIISKKEAKSYVLVLSIIMFLLFSMGRELQNSLSPYMDFIREMNHIFTLFISIFIFIYFKELKIKHNKVINFLAQGSFAIYLLHDNPSMRNIIWETPFKTSAFHYVHPLILIVHIVVCVIGIYLAGCVLEYFRIKFLEQPIFKSKKLQEFTDKIDKFMVVE